VTINNDFVTNWQRILDEHPADLIELLDFDTLDRTLEKLLPQVLTQQEIDEIRADNPIVTKKLIFIKNMRGKDENQIKIIIKVLEESQKRAAHMLDAYLQLAIRNARGSNVDKEQTR
jgi:hypothetical protein